MMKNNIAKWTCDKCYKSSTPIVNIEKKSEIITGKDLFSYSEINGHEVRLTCKICNGKQDSKWVYDSYKDAYEFAEKFFHYCIFNKNIKKP